MRLLLLLLLLVLPLRAADEVPDHYLVPKRRALVIGAGNYEEYGSLRYAVSDAKKVAQHLEQKLGFEVTLLHDDDRQKGELERDHRARLPTSDRIVATFRDLVRRSRDADQFLFYYCGHGEGRADGDVLIPTDLVEGSADLFAIPIHQLIVEELRGMRNAVVMIDACRAGDASSYFGQGFEDLEVEGSVPVLLACGPQQVSHESRDVAGGIFTAALLEGFDVGYEVGGGALWFSGLVKHVCARVPELSPRGEEQRPFTPFNGGGTPFDDEGRFQGTDVLFDPSPSALDGVAAALRVGDGSGLLAYLRDGKRSGWGTQAIEEVTAALWREGRYDLALQLLEFIDQDASFDAGEERERPMLLSLAQLYRLTGDSVALAGTLERVREGAPGSRDGWLAAVQDDTGALDLFERAAAAAALSGQELELPLHTRVVMIDLLSQAGHVEASAAIAHRLQAEVGDAEPRLAAYLAATVATQEGRAREALHLFHAGRQQAGWFPSDASFYLCEYELLQLLGETSVALDCAGEAANAFPEEGAWRIHVAHALIVIAETTGGLPVTSQVELLDQAHEHLVAAIELGLSPADLLSAVTLTRSRALELGDLLEPYVERYPKAWQPALALAFARQNELGSEEAYREAVRHAAEDLSPRAAQVYLQIVRMTYEGAQDDVLRIQVGLDPTAAPDPGLLDQFDRVARFLYGRFYEYLDELSFDPEAWTVFQRLSQLVHDEEGFVATFEAVHGARIDAGDLPVPLVPQAAMSYLAAGRLERFRQLRACIPFPCEAAHDLAWAEAVHLAALGQDDEVGAFLASEPLLPSDELRGAPEAVSALLAARAGEPLLARQWLSRLVDVRKPWCFPLVILTLVELGQVESTEPYWELFTWVSPEGAVGAYVAALQHHPEPRALATFAALRPRSPYTRSFTFAAEPGRDAFKGSYAYTVHPYTVEARFFDVDGWTLFLNQGRGGVMQGSLDDEREEGSGASYPIRGRVDEHGNFAGTLDRGDPEGRVMQVHAKLHPLAQLEADGAVVEAFVVHDEDGARLDLRGRYLPEED